LLAGAAIVHADGVKSLPRSWRSLLDSSKPFRRWRRQLPRIIVFAIRSAISIA
jgi:hypothetical protein